MANSIFHNSTSTDFRKLVAIWQYSHSRGVFVGLFFHEYKIKNTKKIILSH
jgi:hypothetical protein